MRAASSRSRHFGKRRRGRGGSGSGCGRGGRGHGKRGGEGGRHGFWEGGCSEESGGGRHSVAATVNATPCIAAGGRSSVAGTSKRGAVKGRRGSNSGRRGCTGSILQYAKPLPRPAAG
eukprot:315937-Chlamydomonas_euryale.AAC.5